MPGEGNGHSMVIRDPALSQVEADIAETRERVSRSVMALERQIARTVDWREWVRRRPGRVLGIAFAVGWLLGRKR